jgi:elongation factor Ts
VGFARYALGEGIDKKEEDFGEEVRKLAGGGR